jgi:biopolymer transport protein ExbD
MRLRQFHLHQPAGKINVTPLIDVVMVLIIFYLIVGKLAAERQGHVELPTSGIGTQADTHDPVIITIEGIGNEGTQPDSSVPASSLPSPRILVNGTQVPSGGLLAVLTARVAADPGSTVVQVRADRRLPYSDIAPVIKACREAGLTTLRLITEKTNGAPS